MNSVSARRAFGLANEARLLPTLQSIIGEPLTRTSQRYDTFDFSSPNYDVELKCRSDSFTADSYDTWLMPVCKANKASLSKKRTAFFYYFNSTNELYRLDFNPELFTTFQRNIPPWNKDKQEHFYIPRECWTKCVV